MSCEYYNFNNSGNCSSTRWLTEDVFKLIDIVQKDEAIYNPRHKYYFCRPYVENFWREVDAQLEKNPGASLAKWTNLRISFRREYTNFIEEQLSPCWTYFDRMLFLHPFLRKKHPISKAMDNASQEDISPSPDRFQRYSTYNQMSSNAATINHCHTLSNSSDAITLSSPHKIENFVDSDNQEQNSCSEIDDIVENENEREKIRHNMDGRSLDNAIKYECEEDQEDFDETYPSSPKMNTADEDADVDAVEDADVEHNEANNFDWSSKSVNSMENHHDGHHDKQHLPKKRLFSNRHSSRSFQEEQRKRPRSYESISSTLSYLNAAAPHGPQRLFPTHGISQNNVSLVRPTFNKSMDNTNNCSTSVNCDLTMNSMPTSKSFQRNNPHIMSRSESQTTGSIQNSMNSSGVPNNSSTPAHAELCDCKTDHDAMFLMSLLPDIQKLNGRDRGKIKIAFQNILQDFLYPE